MSKKNENLGIQPLNEDVLANLSIDELEERLELQLLHVTEAQACWDCGTFCNQCGVRGVQPAPDPEPVPPGDPGPGPEPEPPREV